MNGIGNIKPGYHARACVFIAHQEATGWSVGRFFIYTLLTSITFPKHYKI